jgi:hypothetical protein
MFKDVAAVVVTQDSELCGADGMELSQRSGGRRTLRSFAVAYNLGGAGSFYDTISISPPDILVTGRWMCQ